MDTAVSVELFVEILNRYVYYFDQQNETVSLSLLPSSPINAKIYQCKTSTDSSPAGDDQIHQRSHRAHPLESQYKPRDGDFGGAKEAFSTNAGLYLQ